MVSVVVLEDDDVQREQIARAVTSYFAARDIKCSLSKLRDANELIEYARSTDRLDLLVADVVLDQERDSVSEEAPRQLGDSFEDRESIHAIDLVQSLMLAERGVQVIYVTGYMEYHTRAYQTEHACFLLKPINQEELDFALDRAMKRLAMSMSKPVLIRTSDEERFVRPSEIVYIESDRRVLCVHVRDEVLRTYGKLGEYEHLLPHRFVRCHKSFLVNMDYIAAFRRSELVLVSGATIPISQSRRKATHDAITSFAKATARVLKRRSCEVGRLDA